ncbi:unnamed protein product [Rhizopus stolonifer]
MELVHLLEEGISDYEERAELEQYTCVNDAMNVLAEEEANLNEEIVEDEEETGHPSNLYDENLEYEIQVPINAFNKIQRYNLEPDEAYEHHNISHAGSRAITTIFNKMLSDLDIKKHHKLQIREANLALVKKTIGRSMTVSHEICVDGCYLFDKEKDQDLACCPICNKARTGSKFKMVSIAEKIAQLLSCRETRDLLKYRHEQDIERERREKGPATEKVYRDVFDGETYQELCQEGMFKNENGVAICINIDGFIGKYTNESMSIIHCIIMNYDPELRQVHAPIVTIYGESHNKALDSFLKPIAKELELLGNKPLIIKNNGNIVTRANFYPLMITGDDPGVSKLNHHDGAQACKHGCRICITCGYHPDDKKDPRGMYFVQRNQIIRTKDGITLKNVVGDNNTYNITQPTVFSMIPSFKGVEFFGLDEMHLLSNCGKFVYELVSPKFNKRFCNEQLPNKYPFHLPIEKRLVIAESLARSRSTIPLSFSGSFEKLNDNTKHLYRSIDWIDFLCEVVPTIVAPLFSNPHTRMALTSLSMTCKMANQFEITASELASIKR